MRLLILHSTKSQKATVLITQLSQSETKESTLYSHSTVFIQTMLSHEVCVIGAGPVGLTLANCLAKSPYIDSVAVVDRKMPKKSPLPDTVPNQRVYSINAPSLQIFQSLNVKSKFRRYGRMDQIEVVSKQSESFVHWSQNEALLIENDELVNALFQNIQEDRGLNQKVKFIEGEIENFVVDGESCDISLSNGGTLKAQLLVGSDGNRSKVKQIAKIPTYGWNYNQRAIVCTLKIDEELQLSNTSGYQIYYEGNVMAILPLWDNYVSIVWSLALPEFEHIMSQSDSEFLLTLNNLINNSNSAFQNDRKYSTVPAIKEVVNKRLSFPLSTLQAGNYAAQRLALIGDAAHSIHPMAGLGVNSGFVDSALLANNIILNRKTGNDIGEAIALSQFESKSKAFNYANSLAMEAIKKTFEVQHPVAKWTRKIGIDLFANSDLIKSQMKSAVSQNPLAEVHPYQWEC